MIPRYPVVKMILVPLIAFASFLAGTPVLNETMRVICGALASASTALYAYLNESPVLHEKDNLDTKVEPTLMSYSIHKPKNE